MSEIIKPTTIRLAGVIRESVVDGPGLRYVIFTQGCPHHCVGCHNPETHDFAGGYGASIAAIVADILQTQLISGVTFSGGEPFCQAAACCEIIRALKATAGRKFNFLAYSGYYYTQLQKLAERDKNIHEFLVLLDTLIDGPFIQDQASVALKFRGSRNQNIIDLRVVDKSQD